MSGSKNALGLRHDEDVSIDIRELSRLDPNARQILACLAGLSDEMNKTRSLSIEAIVTATGLDHKEVSRCFHNLCSITNDHIVKEDGDECIVFNHYEPRSIGKVGTGQGTLRRILRTRASANASA